VGKSKLSYHSWGRAIDINPVQNPYIRGEVVLPPGAVRDAERPGTLLADGAVVAAFESRGWTWGGRWTIGAWCELRGDFRTFDIARMGDITVHEQFPDMEGRRIADYMRIAEAPMR